MKNEKAYRGRRPTKRDCGRFQSGCATVVEVSHAVESDEPGILTVMGERILGSNRSAFIHFEILQLVEGTMETRVSFPELCGYRWQD